MKTLLFSDPHIDTNSIDELNVIFKEIINFNADSLIMLGDYYDRGSHPDDRRRPSAREIEFGTRWAYKFKQKYKDVVFLTGNHDLDRDYSTISYLQYLNIILPGQPTEYKRNPYEDIWEEVDEASEDHKSNYIF